MNVERFHRLLVKVCVAVSLSLTSTAIAQLAPVAGEHYAARPSDTGFAGAVNSQGGYGAMVPLDLPPARGGLAVPVQVVYGGRQVGAAGLGWDVPLTYIYHAQNLAHRRPSPALAPQDRLTLMFGSESIGLVRNAANTAWVARRGNTQLEVRSGQTGTFVMYDGQGSKYQFSTEGAAAGTRLVNGDLYLLRSIIGPGGNSVQLNYTIGAPALPGGAGLSIDLQSVSYNPNPAGTCFKNKIVLSYDTAVTGNPLSMTLMGTTVLARVHKLTKIDVIDRPAACNADVALRTYTFKYQADTDTQQPRLQSVTMAGQAGTPERGVTLPVAAYSYGSIVDPATNQITYEKTQSIAPPFHIGASTFLYGVSHSLAGSSPEPHSPSDVLTDLTTTQTLIDLNGDGRPDFFDETGFYRNTPGANGISTFSALGFSGAAVDARGLIHSAIPNGASSHDRVSDTSINDTLRMEIDMNGDGRVDVVETVPSDIDHWIIHLNTPDPTDPGKIVWVDVKIPVAPMRAALNMTGLIFGRVPLARNTSLRSIFAHCWFWEGFNGRWQEDVVAGCSDIPAGFSLTKTITEFELKDVNGDGYPDFVFNASTVNLTDPVVKPPIPSNPVNLQHASTLVSPDMSGSHDIKVLINTAGAHLTDEANLFAAPPVTLQAGGTTGCGVARWEPDLTITSTDTTIKINQTCGLQDVNGDGIVDRITSSTQNGQLTTTTALGTGDLNSPFAAAGAIQLPGPLGRTESTAFDVQGVWETACQHSATAQSYDIQRTRGLRDINGDGIPDYVSGTRASDGSVHWTVAMGAGTGFTAPINVVSPVGLELSLERYFCPSRTSSVPIGTSSTPTGLYDVDGDGQPEVVTLVTVLPDIAASHWDIYQPKRNRQQGGLGATASIPEAGRLTAIDNGYGAVTHIAYRSAKEDAGTHHNVAFPEIVVATVTTTDSQGNQLTSPTQYAYGNAGMIFDAAFDGFIFRGYGRSVTVRQTVADSTSTGQATITDTYPLTPFDPAMDSATRFKRYLKVGRTSDVTTLSGNVGTDPWALLTADTGHDTRRSGGAHYDWNTRRLTPGPAPSGNESCLDMVYPYNFKASQDFAAAHASDSFDQCAEHGFAFRASTFSWRGTPGSDDVATSKLTVQSSSEVTAVDDFGRVTSTTYDNDLARSDDDFCVQTVYASPTGTNERVLNARASQKVTTCSASPVTLSQESWEYDTAATGAKLPPGTVSNGYVTAHIVTRLDESGKGIPGANGSADIRLFDAVYDALGNPTSVAVTRDDVASHKTTLTYDEFALVTKSARIDATNANGTTLAVQTTTIARDPITLYALSATDPNGTQRANSYDGFGRVVLSKVTPPGSAEGVLASRTYQGFAVGESGGRRVIKKLFTDPVAPANVATAAGRTNTAFFDSLGRILRNEMNLGADYANQTLIVGQRTYDLMGRVAFEADPFPASQGFQTAYGTTYYFNADGTPSCSIRGNGVQAATATTVDEINEIYPTCFGISFGNSTVQVSLHDADSNLSTAPQARLSKISYLSATGRLLEELSRGFRLGQLERIAFTYDALGRRTSMIRYQDPNSTDPNGNEPSAGSNPVTTIWHYDSLGQVTELDEPGTAPKFGLYDSWGELTKAQWCDPTISSCVVAGTINRATISRYDALGRLVHGEDQTGNQTVPETVVDYSYDQPVDTTTPPVKATNVLGRLAKATSPTSSVVYSYDDLGRANARVFTDRTVSSANIYVQKSTYHGDDSLQALDLLLPDNISSPKDEHVDYTYDSAGNLRSVKYQDGTITQDLVTTNNSTDIDDWGRIRQAKYGLDTFTASYADSGRRLLSDVKVASPSNKFREIAFPAVAGTNAAVTPFDPIGRERARNERTEGRNGPIALSAYDALGRLTSKATFDGATATQTTQRGFTYDALGNLLTQTDPAVTGAPGAVTMTYQTLDRDRICSIAYGTATPPAACNVAYDGMGNIISEPSRASGARTFTYFPSGRIQKIVNAGTTATFNYDAFGSVQRLVVTSATSADTRNDKHFGSLIYRRDSTFTGTTQSVIDRLIPGPGGLVATRHGSNSSDPWTFTFGEQRGNRFVTDQTGEFVQDIDYQPFGEVRGASGAQPGSPIYQNLQWNSGDALQALGLNHLGARIYDPALGRFLSRDPLIIPNTAATTNPYAFAANDPVNLSDPSGLYIDDRPPYQCDRDCPPPSMPPTPGGEILPGSEGSVPPQIEGPESIPESGGELGPLPGGFLVPGEVTGGSIRSNDGGGGGRQNLLGSPDYNGNRIYDAVPLDHHVDAISGADINAQDLEFFDRLDRAFERGRYDIRNMSDEALEAKIKALEAEINEIGPEIHLGEAHSHALSADDRDLFERHNRKLMDRKWKMQVFLEERLRRNPLPPRPTLKPLPKTPSNVPFRFPDIFGHNPHQPPADIHNSDDIHGPHWKFYPNDRYNFTRWPWE